MRRRLNLNRPAPQVGPSYNANDEADNPFVEVDRISYQNFDPTTVDKGVGQIPPPSGQPTYGTFFDLRDPSADLLPLAGMANIPTYDIQPKLMRLDSRERRQPLDGYEGAITGSTVIPPTWPTPSTFTTVFHLCARSVVYREPRLFPRRLLPNTLGQPNQLRGDPLHGPGELHPLAAAFRP